MKFGDIDQLEDFQALFDEDFQLVHEQSTRDDVEHELNYLQSNKEAILEKCIKDGVKQPCLIEYIDQDGEPAEL